MTASYTRFLAAVRAKRPQAWLVALRPFGGPYADAIRQAVAARAAAGDKRVRFVDTTGWLDGADFRDGVHPNDGGNVKAARRLTPLLRPLLGLPTSPPAAVTVGDPKNPAALARQILDAYVGGARRIVVRPGVYVLPDFGRTALRLDAWEDVTLSGFGATLILTDLAWMHDGIDLSRCRGVTVRGFRISQNRVTAYQGKIIGVGKNSDGKPYCDWRPDAGYPVPPNDEPKGFLGGDVNVADARTRRLKLGVGDFYGVKAARLPNGTFRALMGGPFGVGDRLVGRYGDAPFKVFLDGSRNCTLQDLTLTRNGFSPIREDNGGGNRVIHCVWKLGPKPPGATEEPLVTNAADGLHSTGANPGPDIENCVMEGVFLDDNFAIHGSLQTVKSAAGRVLTLDGGVGNLTVGQPIRLSDDKGFYADARVTALQENENKTTSVTLDKDLAVPAGAKASNPLRDGAGYKIIGCRLGRTRSRGILVKADNGQIKNNVIESCGMSAVSIGPEYYWNEADYAHHVLIENNTLRGNGQAGYGGAAIFIHGDGARGNQNIIVRANTMVSNYQGDIDVQWTNGVTLTGNSFTGVSPNPADFKDCALLTLSNCRAIQLAKNVVSNADAYKAGLIVLGTNAADVQNNTPAGLRTLKARAMKSK